MCSECIGLLPRFLGSWQTNSTSLMELLMWCWKRRMSSNSEGMQGQSSERASEEADCRKLPVVGDDEDTEESKLCVKHLLVEHRQQGTQEEVYEVLWRILR